MAAPRDDLFVAAYDDLLWSGLAPEVGWAFLRMCTLQRDRGGEPVKSRLQGTAEVVLADVLGCSRATARQLLLPEGDDGKPLITARQMGDEGQRTITTVEVTSWTGRARWSRGESKEDASARIRGASDAKRDHERAKKAAQRERSKARKAAETEGSVSDVPTDVPPMSTGTDGDMSRGHVPQVSPHVPPLSPDLSRDTETETKRGEADGDMSPPRDRGQGTGDRGHVAAKPDDPAAVERARRRLTIGQAVEAHPAGAAILEATDIEHLVLSVGQAWPDATSDAAVLGALAKGLNECAALKLKGLKAASKLVRFVQQADERDAAAFPPARRKEPAKVRPPPTPVSDEEAVAGLEIGRRALAELEAFSAKHVSGEP